MHQIGILPRILARFGGNRNNQNNEPQHRDPNADDDESDNRNIPPPAPLTYAQLLQRFLFGIFASLWPTWDHRNLYPPVGQ